MVLYGPQGNSLGLLYALANKFTVFSQVYSTTGKQVSTPSSPPAAPANFLYQPTLCLMQNFSPITYPSKGIRWLLCECELVTICIHTNNDKQSVLQRGVITGVFLWRPLSVSNTPGEDSKRTFLSFLSSLWNTFGGQIN